MYNTYCSISAGSLAEGGSGEDEVRGPSALLPQGEQRGVEETLQALCLAAPLPTSKSSFPPLAHCSISPPSTDSGNIGGGKKVSMIPLK